VGPVAFGAQGGRKTLCPPSAARARDIKPSTHTNNRLATSANSPNGGLHLP